MNPETKVPKPIGKRPGAKSAAVESDAARKAKFERLLWNLTQAKWPLSPEMMRSN